jgi:hypothetical protein
MQGTGEGLFVHTLEHLVLSWGRRDGLLPLPMVTVRIPCSKCQADQHHDPCTQTTGDLPGREIMLLGMGGRQQDIAISQRVETGHLIVHSLSC